MNVFRNFITYKELLITRRLLFQKFKIVCYLINRYWYSLFKERVNQFKPFKDFFCILYDFLSVTFDLLYGTLILYISSKNLNKQLKHAWFTQNKINYFLDNYSSDSGLIFFYCNLQCTSKWPVYKLFFNSIRISIFL